MAATSATTEVPAGHTSFPPFETENFPSQLVWLALTFILLYVLMAKIALPRIGSIIEERSKHIADHVAAANQYKEQSDAAHAAYEKSLAEARGRAQEIAASTHEKHLADAEALGKKLEAELHEKLAAAERSIAATRSAAMANVGTIAADAAAALVERLIGQAPAKQDVDAALATVMKR